MCSDAHSITLNYVHVTHLSAENKEREDYKEYINACLLNG